MTGKAEAYLSALKKGRAFVYPDVAHSTRH